MDLAPIARQQFFDNNGNPLAGGLLYTYVAGTNTPKATYSDYTGGTPNSNPIVLDSAGYADIWIGTGYWKFVLHDSNDVPVWTKDHVGLPSTTAQSPPAGGLVNQSLRKKSGSDYDFQWTSQDSVTVTTASYTVLNTDKFILVNASSAVTITLPDPTGKDGLSFIIKRNGNGVITVVSTVGNIDGSSSAVMNSSPLALESITVFSQGGNYYIC